MPGHTERARDAPAQSFCLCTAPCQGRGGAGGGDFKKTEHLLKEISKLYFLGHVALICAPSRVIDSNIHPGMFSRPSALLGRGTQRSVSAASLMCSLSRWRRKRTHAVQVCVLRAVTEASTKGRAAQGTGPHTSSSRCPQAVLSLPPHCSLL